MFVFLWLVSAQTGDRADLCGGFRGDLCVGRVAVVENADFGGVAIASSGSSVVGDDVCGVGFFLLRDRLWDRLDLAEANLAVESKFYGTRLGSSLGFLPRDRAFHLRAYAKMIGLENETSHY